VPFEEKPHARPPLDDYLQHLLRNGPQDSYELLTDRKEEVFQFVAESKSNAFTLRILCLLCGEPASVILSC